MAIADDIRVTIAIASYNCERYLEAAVRSALAQSDVSLEVVIVDDRSTDGSLAVAERLAAADPCVRVAQLATNSGPGGARNHALALARGTWFAVLDSDDLYHPRRLAQLIGHAERHGLDIVADDLLLFQDDESAPPHRFLTRRSDRAHELGIADYLADTVMFGRAPNLGFLKPVIRRSALVAHDLRYDPSLRIAEDDDLVIRMLAAGMRYGVVPSLTYFYRKHGASISHRMGDHHLEAMIAAGDRQRALFPRNPMALAGLARRDRAFRRARSFARFIDALKARRPAAAVRLAIADPGMVPLLRMPVQGAFAKLKARFAMAKDAGPADGRRHATIVSRQRLIGPTNGSSAYLLDLVEAVRGAGYVPHLVQPAPSLLGRIPVLKLHPSMAVFETHRIRGVVRIGQWVVARDPQVWAGALRGVASRLGRRIGLKGDWLADRPAPYAIAIPWTDADRLFVADALRGRHDVVLADYVFQAEAFPYALGTARTAIVMHDLFHARDDGTADAAQDSVARLDRATEIGLLGRGDGVIAIQAAEARFVAEYVPDTDVVLAPMASRPAPHAQPGTGATLLFVGSNTAPNVVGLQWFIDSVWPSLRSAVPGIELRVAGTVARAFVDRPEGITFLGIVDDLAPEITAAAVLISPLTFGSGLKIKLIEAMGAGKAVVATGVTMQGLEDIGPDAVRVSDDPQGFADAIRDLIADEPLRRRMGEAALAEARRRFSPAVAHAALAAWLQPPVA